MTLDELRAKLAEARSGFDRAYEYSDDYSHWSRHREKAAIIADCERRIAALEAAEKGDTP